MSAELETVLWQLVEGISLTSQEQDRLFVLLMEYADIVALSNDQLDKTYMLQHRIHTGDAAPVRQQFRKMHPKKRQELQSLLTEMLDKNVIQSSNSPWTSPVALVRKMALATLA